MKIKIFLIILLALCLTSCGVTKISLASDYSKNNKKLGIIQVKQEIGIFRSGQGILDRAISPGNKYKEPLETVDKKLKTGALYLTISNQTASIPTIENVIIFVWRYFI